MTNSTTTQKLFHDLLKEFDAALLITQSADQQMRCRPMAIADIENDSDIWFVTSLDAGKVSEITAHRQVCVAMQKGRRYLSLSGKAHIVHDGEKIKELWNTAWKVWFPEGHTDPSIALIHVETTEGEFWDTSGLKGLKYLFKAGKAYLAGEQMQSDPELSAKVNL
jgi:general stress protein 26